MPNHNFDHYQKDRIEVRKDLLQHKPERLVQIRNSRTIDKSFKKLMKGKDGLANVVAVFWGVPGGVSDVMLEQC